MDMKIEITKEMRNGMDFHLQNGSNVGAEIVKNHIADLVSDVWEAGKDDPDLLSFYVILSLDVPKDVSILRIFPNGKVKNKMTITEDGESEYSYLEGEWEKGSKHRKYVGELTWEDLNWLYYYEVYIEYEDVETMGSLTEYGWLPAFSFDNYNSYDSSIVNAYVTPLMKTSFIEKLFEVYNDFLTSEQIENIVWETLKEKTKEDFS